MSEDATRSDRCRPIADFVNVQQEAIGYLKTSTNDINISARLDGIRL